MLIDARTLPESTIIDAEVCIVGAGAAGITLTREFIGQPFRVCLLESGGLEFNQDTQSLYEGENIGLPYSPLNVSRLRYFGGTTNHWSGWCRPLDDLDFETRDWVPHSGWPFDRSHLDSFYERAQVICQLGPYAYDVEAWETKKLPRFPVTGDRVVSKIFQFSPPTRFGKVYRDEIVHADNISIYPHANVVDIETTKTARTVTRLRIACLQGNKFWVTAKLFILATGGIENARLLLLSNTIQVNGLGNQNDLVGRFFMDNPELRSGLVLPSDPYELNTDLYIFKSMMKTGLVGKIKGFLTLSSETQHREKLLNFSADLEPSWTKGVTSLRRSLQAINRRDLGNFVKHLGRVIAEIDEVTVAVYAKFFRQGFPIKLFTLYNRVEQAPNPDSRVTLTTERDSLGKRRVKLDWQLSPIDKHSIRRAHEIIGMELGRAGLGRLKITLDDDADDWPPIGGLHHIGTTRMHSSPKKGVVNENCQVHGLSNLFIAGSSVFPTAGSAPPTLTIVALALRLADHVKRLMT